MLEIEIQTTRTRRRLILSLVLSVLALVGEIRCVYKMCTCNWEPVGKAEIIYTVAGVSGAGAIVGWFNIKDE